MSWSSVFPSLVSFSDLYLKQDIYKPYYKSRESKFLSVKLSIFSYTSVLTYVLGAQKNCLIETVLLSTNNICFCKEIRKINCDKALLISGRWLGKCLFSSNCLWVMI